MRGSLRGEGGRGSLRREEEEGGEVAREGGRRGEKGMVSGRVEKFFYKGTVIF